MSFICNFMRKVDQKFKFHNDITSESKLRVLSEVISQPGI
jgi:hypothetical protein